MIQALAPRMPQGCSWVWLSIVLTAALGPASAPGQETKPAAPKPAEVPAAKKADAPAAKKAAAAAAAKGADAVKEADAPAAKEADAPAAAPPEAQAGAPASGVEVYKDERAEKALEIFKSVPGLRPASPAIITAVKGMAAGQANVDRDTLQRFVDGMAYALADRGNINALINPPPNLSPNAASTRAVKEATDNLLDALFTARQANNTSFLTEYNRVLLGTLPKLLDNNLVTRIEAMIVLGQAGDPNALPIFVSTLKDPNQTVWVKLWAARGLYVMVGGGTRVDAVLNAARAGEAGKASADFLDSEKDLPWPAQMRGLEALGAMRQAALTTAQQKADMANAAMQRLADAESRPEVRASAAWAMGMLRVNPSLSKYNFGLVAYVIGRLAADLGASVNSAFDGNRTLSEYHAGLLVGPVFQAFNGVDGARESGLLKGFTGHPNAASSQAAVRQIADLQSSLARAAVELVRAPPGQVKARREDLGQRVAALRAYLDKNPPKDFHLVPGGPEYRVSGGQVATGPGAGAPGGQ